MNKHKTRNIKEHKHPRLSLVYDADAVFKTPDEEIAFQFLNKVRQMEEIEPRPSLIARLLSQATKKCMRRHIVESCLACVKLGFCKIHELDIKISRNGLKNVLAQKRYR